MSARRLLVVGLKAGVVVGLLGVLYLGITLVQVWDASGDDHARPAEAIVVFGAAQYDGRPSPVLRARLDHAFDLWQQGLADVVVVTGGRQPGDRFTEAGASAQYLIDRGVPDATIRREVQGTNSWESLAASARFLRSEGIDEVLLVSDPYHSLRISAIAAELGLQAYVSPADVSVSARDMLRETVAVAAGRLVGFRRLVDIDKVVTERTGGSV